jgi:hypothetical protein
MTGAPFGRAGGKPRRNCTSSTPWVPPSKDGRGLGRPDVVARLEVRRRAREYDGGADLAERL